MGLLQRVSDILKANINRILDQAEDPEMVLDTLIQEMQDSYRKSKIEVAKALADEKRLKHMMQTNQDMASKWGRKAVLAVEKNDDDLAREALKRKRSYEDISHEFESQWTEQKKVTDILRENLFGLESKIDEARRKKSLLVARQKRVIAQKKLQDTLEQAGSEQNLLTMGRFEEKITEIEARAEAEIDIIDGQFDGRFRELENRGDNVEDELAALKTQVGGRKDGDQKLLAADGGALPQAGHPAPAAVPETAAPAAEQSTSAAEPEPPAKPVFKVEAKPRPVVKVEEAPAARAEEAPPAKAEEAPAARAVEAPAAKAVEAPAAKAEEAPAARAEEAPAARAEEAPAARAEEAPAARAEEAPAAEPEVAPGPAPASTAAAEPASSIVDGNPRLAPLPDTVPAAGPAPAAAPEPAKKPARERVEGGI